MAHIQVCEEMSGLGGMASVTSAIFLPCSPGRLHLSQVNLQFTECVRYMGIGM